MNRSIALVLAAFALLPACGKSGSREDRPIEKIFYVEGFTGTPFRVHRIVAANALHEFPGEVFTAPYYFVLENAEPPVSGTFEALGTDLVVTLAVGEAPMRTRVTLPVGEPVTLQTDDGPPPAGVVHDDQVRIDVVSADGIETEAIPFFATLGDELNTDLTSCFIDDLSDPTGAQSISNICASPATFFIEEPKNYVSGVFEVSNSQRSLRATLYVDGDQKDSDESDDDVIVKNQL